MASTEKQFSPQKLRTVLAGVLVLVILGGAAGFYWGLGIVRSYALDVNHRLIDADASSLQVQQLQTLRQTLNENSDLIQKADQVFALPNTYQTQALVDVQAYARVAGISITSTEFDDSTPGSYILTLQLSNPVSYSGLITFLNNIEGNIPKISVQSLTLGPPDNANPNAVNVKDIKLNIYVRQQ
ncbi:MAG: hypothetical protein WAR37_01705 [Candidatus Microsaccharimonas sp.]